MRHIRAGAASVVAAVATAATGSGVAAVPVLAETPVTAAGTDAILFTSARAGRRSIWRVGVAGGSTTRVTFPPRPRKPCGCRAGEFDTQPAWSPDRQRVAFVRGARVYIASADGLDLRVVPGPPGTEDFAPSWAATGRLAFIRQRPAVGGSVSSVHEIRSVDAAGGRPARLAGPSGFAYGSFAWSSDGAAIAYTVPYYDPAFVVGLFVDRVGDGKPSRFLMKAAGIGGLSWSPDDRVLVIASAVPGADPYDPYRLFTIRLADRTITQLTDIPYGKTADGAPAWSPDGRTIAFTRSEPRSDAVYLVRPDGAGERLLVEDARGGAWSPDGRWLAVIEGIAGEQKRLTLTVVATRDGLRRPLVRLRRPFDVDPPGPQSWR